jgi:hypothetical protein
MTPKRSHLLYLIENKWIYIWHDTGNREIRNTRAQPRKEVRTMANDLIKNGKAGKSSTSWKPAILPTLALIAVGVFPPMLKGLYEQYTSQLMVAYVSFGMLFVAFVLGGLSLMVIRDLSMRRQKVFRLAPSEQTARHDDGAVPVKLERDRHRINNGTK